MSTKGTIFLSMPIPAPGRKLLDPEFIVREWPEDTITTEALHAGVSGVDAMLIHAENPVDKSLLDAADKVVDDRLREEQAGFRGGTIDIPDFCYQKHHRASENGRLTIWPLKVQYFCLSQSQLPVENFWILWPEDTIITTEALHAGVSGVDAMLIQTEIPVDKSLLDAAGSQLKVVSTMSTGVDHIDISECRRRGIVIGYTPVMTDAMADLTVGLLLATSRRFKEGLHAVEQSHFEWENGYWNCGKQLTGSTVGIVGLGRIGMAVAKRLQAFGVSNILYSGPNEKFDATAVGAIFVTFDKLLEESDFVVVCCSLNAENKEMFNKKSFSKMKLDSVFINISRGALVNQDDLYEALTNGTIISAGLDATSPEPLPADHPLLTLKNCTILPHLGGATIQTRNKMAMTAARNAIAGFKGQTLPLPVP